MRKRVMALGFSAAVMVASPLVSYYEGLRVKAYLDPVGIPTICYGETEGVTLGQVKTKKECEDMLSFRLAWFAWQVHQSVTVEVTPKTHAALTSFAYNVGMGAFNRSTLRRKLNRGDIVGACRQLPRWVYAKGKRLKGLVKRRNAEMMLCLEGIHDLST